MHSTTITTITKTTNSVAGTTEVKDIEINI